MTVSITAKFKAAKSAENGLELLRGWRAPSREKTSQSDAQGTPLIPALTQVTNGKHPQWQWRKL